MCYWKPAAPAHVREAVVVPGTHGLAGGQPMDLNGAKGTILLVGPKSTSSSWGWIVIESSVQQTSGIYTERLLNNHWTAIRVALNDFTYLSSHLTSLVDSYCPSCQPTWGPGLVDECTCHYSPSIISPYPSWTSHRGIQDILLHTKSLRARAVWLPPCAPPPPWRSHMC